MKKPYYALLGIAIALAALTIIFTSCEATPVEASSPYQYPVPGVDNSWEVVMWGDYEAPDYLDAPKYTVLNPDVHGASDVGKVRGVPIAALTDSSTGVTPSSIKYLKTLGFEGLYHTKALDTRSWETLYTLGKSEGMLVGLYDGVKVKRYAKNIEPDSLLALQQYTADFFVTTSTHPTVLKSYAEHYNGKPVVRLNLNDTPGSPAFMCSLSPGVRNNRF